MKSKEYIYYAKIINVVDGDTCDLAIDLGFYTYKTERVRLAGIDTPELNSADPEKRAKAAEAKLFLLKFLNMDVTIESYKKDKYGRFLAEIHADGNETSINKQLIQEGLAVPYSGGSRVP